MSTERWRPIPDFPGYEASTWGRIRSHKVDPAGRLLAVTVNKRNGYLYVGPYRDGEQRFAPIHVLVAATFIGPRPEGYHTRHLDGSKTNNVPSNLAYGTPAENAADAIAHGTMGRQPWALDRGSCINGHPYTQASIHLTSGGWPRCRVCDRLQTAARRAKRRLEIAAPSVHEERAA